MAGHLQQQVPGRPDDNPETNASRLSLLVVGSSSLGRNLPAAVKSKASVTIAASLPRAMGLLRMTGFDLVVVSEDLTAARAIRRQWNWQPWVYVGCRVMPGEETEARSLGAVAVLDEISQINEISEISEISEINKMDLPADDSESGRHTIDALLEIARSVRDAGRAKTRHAS